MRRNVQAVLLVPGLRSQAMDTEGGRVRLTTASARVVDARHHASPLLPRHGSSSSSSTGDTRPRRSGPWQAFHRSRGAMPGDRYEGSRARRCWFQFTDLWPGQFCVPVGKKKTGCGAKKRGPDPWNGAPPRHSMTIPAVASAAASGAQVRPHARAPGRAAQLHMPIKRYAYPPVLMRRDSLIAVLLGRFII